MESEFEDWAKYGNRDVNWGELGVEDEGGHEELNNTISRGVESSGICGDETKRLE